MFTGDLRLRGKLRGCRIIRPWIIRPRLYPELLYCQFCNQDHRIGFSFTILKEDRMEFELTRSGDYYYLFWVTDFHHHFGR
jgi:hypothetical protein